MERPEIKDKKIQLYVDWLEKQLANYRSDKTRAKSYLGLKNIVDQVNEATIKAKLVVEEKDIDNMSDEDKKAYKKEKVLQQQYLEKAMEMSGQLEEYNDALDRMEKQINPDILIQAKKEVEVGSIYEEALNATNENK